MTDHDTQSQSYPRSPAPDAQALEQRILLATQNMSQQAAVAAPSSVGWVENIRGLFVRPWALGSTVAVLMLVAVLVDSQFGSPTGTSADSVISGAGLVPELVEDDVELDWDELLLLQDELAFSQL